MSRKLLLMLCSLWAQPGAKDFNVKSRNLQNHPTRWVLNVSSSDA